MQEALAAFQQGDLARAERLCAAALRARPGDFQALYLAGLVAGARGRPAEAAGFFARAAAIDARQADVHFNLGVALGELGRHGEALAAYDRALALAPARADAHFNRAVALAALGRHAESLEGARRALAAQPDFAAACHQEGLALAELGRPSEALASFDRALALRPGHAQAHNNRGVALARLGRGAEALAAYDRAIALRPDHAAAWCHRGIALLELDHASSALESLERALQLRPDHAEAHYNRGNALRDLHRHDEAIAAYERAIALEPAHAAAHWNLADLLLMRGDFARGWAEYEWRWKLPARREAARAFAQPLWRGAEPLAGRRILLHAELGLGDTLQFCRYVPEVARRGATVVLEAQAPLLPLLATLEGVSELVRRGDALPPFDCHCPLMSLPLAFHTGPGGIPADIPYLRSDPARVQRWRARLGDAPRRRIGFVWSGSRGLRNDRRSMALAQMLPLSAGDAQWVSLQKEMADEERALLATRADVLDLGAGLADFADTAAVVELLDLLVTVDTSVAHVAGALGKPVWILLPRNAHDWRWLLDREDSLWYPSARLFRQQADGGWDGVVQRVSRALEALPATA